MGNRHSGYNNTSGNTLEITYQTHVWVFIYPHFTKQITPILEYDDSKGELWDMNQYLKESDQTGERNIFLYRSARFSYNHDS